MTAKGVEMSESNEKFTECKNLIDDVKAETAKRIVEYRNANGRFGNTCRI